MRYIVLTGDSSGLGKELAVSLIRMGYGVIGISRHFNEEAEKISSEGEYIHIDFDLSETQRIKELYLQRIKEREHIVGLINNAAVAYDDIITNANYDSLEYMFRINVLSPIMLTKYIIRDMLLKGTSGSLIHITSVCAHTGYKGLSMYAATKGALEAFSKGVAREWGRRNIRSNCIAPGFMETRMSSSLTGDQKDRIYNRTCLGKATDLSSVVNTVIFLFSEEARSITGTTIHIDSGTM